MDGTGGFRCSLRQERMVNKMAKVHSYGLERGSKLGGGKNGGAYNNNSRGGYNNNRNSGGYNNSRNQGGYGGGNRQNFSSDAVPTAPYNFVRLNDMVVQPPLGDFLKGADDNKALQEGYKNFIRSSGKYSGYFDVQIKNTTPLYIAGTDGFFSDGRNLCIPGSSLRGCLKNMLKVIPNGRMNVGSDPDVTDRILYYRTFASAYKKLRGLYADEMTQLDRDSKGKSINVVKSQPGFLVRKDKDYYVCPAEMRRIKRDNPPGPDIRWEDDYVDVFTGKINGKKHYYRFTGAQWNKCFTVSKNLLNSYRDDKNRKGLNLLDNKKYGRKGSSGCRLLYGVQYDYIIPCFYVENNGEVAHFGAGPYYRIPYKKSIGDHIPDVLRTDKVDFTAAMFGNKEAWSSRVFFEDLYLRSSGKAALCEKKYLRPLLGPNPTSFQNYLETGSNNEAMHWEEDSKLRGYKFYWHKNADWALSEVKNANVTKQIAPVQYGNYFCGRIRFENLDKTELGALCRLFIMGEEKNCCFKLGMGKPFGMGSAEIRADLYLQDKNKYYGRLFADGGFYEGTEKADKTDFANGFHEYMLSKMSPVSRKLYEERMEELKIIMSMDNKNKKGWDAKTAYMDINDKSNRPLVNNRVPLPDIKTVVKG